MPDTRDIIADIDALLSGEVSGPEQVKAVLEKALPYLWQPIETAKKDRTSYLLRLKNPIPREGRPDLEKWNGLIFVGRHPGLADDGFDVGWNFAAPVGHGGFPDDWIDGWMPLPPAPVTKDPTP